MPLGVGIHTHTHMSVYSIYIVSFLLLYIAYRTGTQVSTHTHTFWLYMVHSASNAKTHWHSFVLLHASALHSALLHQSKKNKTHWHTEHVAFFCIHSVFINCVLPLKQNLLARPSFSKFLSFMSCIASPKQQKQNARAH